MVIVRKAMNGGLKSR